MKFPTNDLLIKFLFASIWSFFIYRLGSYINPSINIIQFNQKNWINFFNDLLSIIIIVGLFIYLLIYLINKKKISYIVILIIYPIFGLIGYLINYELHEQNPLIWHQFITLTSVLLFLAIIQSSKIFDYPFKELLLKIILLFIFIFLLFVMAPKFYLNLSSPETIRGGDLTKFSLFNNKIYFEQNVNGFGRILFIIQILFLFLFKKFIFNKKILAHLFFFTAVFLATIIYLIQSRFNILASFLFTFFLLINIKNLNLIRKILYILVFIFLPIFIFNTYSKIFSRFLIHNINNEIIINSHINIRNTAENINNILSDKSFENINNISSDKSLVKYSKLKENILFVINEIEKVDNIDNIIKSEFIYKKIIIINNEIKKIESENKINEIKIIDQLISEGKKLVNGFNKIILMNCSPALSYVDSLFTGRICGWEILLKNIQINELFFGKGYFADQIYLKNVQKTSSNSWINILFNAGIVSLFVCVTCVIYIFFKFFNFKNTNHENIYLSISHNFFLYFTARSIFEDTIAFVSIDFLMLCICLILITESTKKNQ
jgi:hypothetical protein